MVPDLDRLKKCAEIILIVIASILLLAAIVLVGQAVFGSWLEWNG